MPLPGKDRDGCPIRFLLRWCAHASGILGKGQESQSPGHKGPFLAASLVVESLRRISSSKPILSVGKGASGSMEKKSTSLVVGVLANPTLFNPTGE